MAVQVRARVLPVMPEKSAVAGGTRVKHRPPTPPLIDFSESEEEMELGSELLSRPAASMELRSAMAAGHMEVGKLPFGSDSLQSKEVLESMSRKELQALAKERGITANSKSAVIIGKILEQHPACLNAGDSSEKSEEELREIAESELFAYLRAVQDEHARVMAIMAETLAKYAGAGGNSMFSDESLVQRYEEVEKHMTSTIHQMFQNAVNRLSPPPVPNTKRKARKKKAKMAPPEPPISVKTAVRYVAVFVEGVPGTVGNKKLQTVFNTEALVGRFESGHCKVLVPESELVRALGQNSVSGHEIHVKKWRVREDHHHDRRHRRHGRNREVSNTIETCMKTIGTRMKAIETAMKRALERIASTEKRR